MKQTTKKIQSQSLPGNVVVIVAIVAVLVLISAVLYFVLMHPKSALSPASTQSTQQTTNATQPVVANTSDNSDPALDQDIQKVGTNINSLDSQNTYVDQGLTQQAVDPSQ